jgi:hypothetical protein
MNACTLLCRATCPHTLQGKKQPCCFTVARSITISYDRQAKTSRRVRLKDGSELTLLLDPGMTLKAHQGRSLAKGIRGSRISRGLRKDRWHDGGLRLTRR